MAVPTRGGTHDQGKLQRPRETERMRGKGKGETLKNTAYKLQETNFAL